MMVAVLPGVALTRARALRLTSLLIREDLPTLDLPEKTISGAVHLGSWSFLPAANSNSTF